jgi:hypothetical protein
VEVIYCENDELYEALDCAQEELDDKEQEIRALK